jgi:hypothetical protein
MHRYNRSVFQFILPGCLVLLSLSICAVEVEAKLLVGGVQQSGYLMPITPALSGEIAQAAQQPSVNWSAIPRWMSGQWTKEGDVTISMTDLRTGTESSGNCWRANRITRQFGHQLDKAGDVWRALLVPAEEDGEAMQESVVFLLLAVKLESTTANELITRTRYLVSQSSGWGVCKQYQQESLNHYFPSKDGALQNRSYIRIFDLSGRPQRDAVLISQWRKVGPFQPVQTLHGIDLHESLNYYLHTHNLSDLATTNSFLKNGSP